MAADNIPQLAAPRVANPFGSTEPVRQSGLVSVDQQRVTAEVQGMIVAAHHMPRNQQRAMDRILNACTRVTLAEKAHYSYARGGNAIEGESIRLAECLAQNWGNVSCGIAEISRHDGVSECVAYAWDLETNYRVDMKFQVKHWRDLREGRGYAVTSERDIYEVVANQGARRKRSCILAVIPGDVVEAASNACRQTLIAKADTSPAALKQMVDAFGELGVTQPMIEQRIQRRLEAIRPAQIVMLRSVYNALKDGVADVADHFEAVPLEDAGEPAPQAEPQPAAQPRQRRTRRAPDREPPPDVDTDPVGDRGSRLPVFE
jgi:hypothetical protein